MVNGVELKLTEYQKELLSYCIDDLESRHTYYQEYHEAAAAPHLGDHYGTRYTVCTHPQCREASRGFTS